MRKRVYLAYLLFCFCKPIFAQKKNPSLSIFSIGFRSTTPIAISCDYFMAAFEGRIDTGTCYSKDSIQQLNTYLKQVTYAKHPGHMDTRARFEYVDDQGKMIIICVDHFVIRINDTEIVAFPAFRKFLLSLIPRKNLVDLSGNNALS